MSSNSKITIVGCGLLGSMLAPSLAAFIVSLAFETEIVLIDNDEVEKRNSPSNLLVPASIGMKKVEVVSRVYLAADLKVTKRAMRLTEKSTWMLKDSTVIIGALDNVETRLLMARFSQENNVPYLDLGLSFTGGLVSWTDGEMSTMPFTANPDYKVDEDKKPACELIGTRLFSAMVVECATLSLFIYLSAHDPAGIIPPHLQREARNGDMVNWNAVMDGTRAYIVSQFVGNHKGG